MPRFPARFLLAALLTAWTVDIFFWMKPVGINYLIWVVVVLAGLAALLIFEKVRPAWVNLALVIPILALAATAFTRREELTVFIGVALSLLGLMLLAATTRTGNWVFYRMGDVIKAFALTWWAGVTRSPALYKRSAPVEGEAPAVGAGKRFLRNVGPVLLGLALALPLVTILAALLASADPIFSDRLNEFFKIFDLQRLPEYIFRAFYTLMLAWVFTGVYLHAVLPTRDEPRPDPQKAWMKPFLGFTEGNVVLICVDALFAFFVILQFQYFFGGASNINVSGYTFSEYAVRGFNELVWVAVISLLTYLGLSTIAKRQGAGQRRTFSVLAILLLGLVLVILVSAWYRLGLYEQAYGFTRLRTYTHIFIPWLGGLLAVTILLELFSRRGRFALALLAVIVGFGLTFPILNVDGFIARKNLARAAQGLELDSFYLKQLSTDAVPVLLAEYTAAETSPAVKDALGAELACRAAMTAAEEPRPWQGYNLSESRASRLLAENAAGWSAVSVRHNPETYPEWEVQVNGEWQNCDYEGYMD